MTKPTPMMSVLKGGIAINHEPFQFTATLLREFAKARGAIMVITTEELDHLLEPYIRFGMLSTEYNRITGATEYRGPTGALIAMTVGKRHFCRRVSGPIILGQWIGRIERKPQPVQWHLEDRKTGQKIEVSEFTIKQRTTL